MSDFELRFQHGGPMDRQFRMIPVEPGQEAPAQFMEFREPIEQHGGLVREILHRYVRVGVRPVSRGAWRYDYVGWSIGVRET